MVGVAAVFAAGGTFGLGELTVVQSSDGAVVRGPGPDNATVPADPDAIRELVSLDAAGKYRPLAGARSLPSGWRVKCQSAAELASTLDAIYPLAPAHIEQWRAGTLRIVSLADVLARQTARYAVANELTVAGRAAASESLCRRCVKAPVWTDPCDPPLAGAPVQEVPCPEPCSVLVSLCREAALWEKKMPPASSIDPAAPFADFEAPGNEVREDCLARMRGNIGAPRG